MKETRWSSSSMVRMWVMWVPRFQPPAVGKLLPWAMRSLTVSSPSPSVSLVMVSWMLLPVWAVAERAVVLRV